MSSATGAPTTCDHVEDARRLLGCDVGYVDAWPAYEVAKVNALQSIAYALLAIHAELRPDNCAGQVGPVDGLPDVPGDGWKPLQERAWFVELDRRGRTLLGTADIAELLGVSRPRVWQLRKHPDFPAPAATRSGRDYWPEQAIRRWARLTGRSLTDSVDQESGAHTTT